MNQTAVIIGGSSGLGRCLAETLGKKGVTLIIAAREEKDLQIIANDIQFRYGVTVHVIKINLINYDAVTAERFVSKCFTLSSTINQVYFTAGVVSDSDNSKQSGDVLREITETNFIGIAFLITYFSQKLNNIKSNITVISSVAAIRPRAMNIAYSSAKIALENYILGFKHYYTETDLNFQIYRVGYMDTQMSFGKKLLFPVASVQNVSEYIISNRLKKKTLWYYPKFWTFVALILKLLPWFIYKKLKF